MKYEIFILLKISAKARRAAVLKIEFWNFRQIVEINFLVIWKFHQIV